MLFILVYTSTKSIEQCIEIRREIYERFLRGKFTVYSFECSFDKNETDKPDVKIIILKKERVKINETKLLADIFALIKEITPEKTQILVKVNGKSLSTQNP